MRWSATIYICHGQQAGMEQTYKIGAGAPEIDRK